MTLAQLEKRVERLEKIISTELLVAPKRNAKWWLNQAGVFSDDPGQDEMVRLGRKYRRLSGRNRARLLVDLLDTGIITLLVQCVQRFFTFGERGKDCEIQFRLRFNAAQQPRYK